MENKKSRLEIFKERGLIGCLNDSGVTSENYKKVIPMEIDEDHLLELIFWARRYCDNRSTYSPTRFNHLYENIVRLNPELKEKDQFDHTLKDKGKYWPWAQDGMYNEEKGHYDARPRNYCKKDACDGK